MPIPTSQRQTSMNTTHDRIIVDGMNLADYITYVITGSPPNPVTYNYIIAIEGSTYVARDVNGDSVTSSASDLGAVFNYLTANRVASGDVIYLDVGAYTANTALTFNSKTNITLNGASRDTVTVTRGNVANSFLILNGTNNIVKNIAWDDNNQLGTGYNIYTLAITISGSYNIFDNNKFLHSWRYGIGVAGAHNFTISNNYINQAQYGISGTSSYTGNPNIYRSYDGSIIGNSVYDSRDCSIKIKGMTNVTVTNNYCDVGYLTWTTNASGSGTEGCLGIRFYTDDDADYGCTIANNTIVDSQHTKITAGITEDLDRCLDNTSLANTSNNLQANNNAISNCYYGMLIKKAAEITYSGNTFPIASRNSDIHVTG